MTPAQAMLTAGRTNVDSGALVDYSRFPTVTPIPSTPARMVAPMMHIYRDPKVVGSRPWTAAVVGLAPLVLLAVFVLGWRPFTWGEAVSLFVLAGLWAVSQYHSYGRENYRDCVEIRLGDDGTCELEMKRRVIRLHVNEIQSVRYSRDSDDRESYTIRCQGQKIHVAGRMTDFSDFLTRLKALNPAVDLTSFPADAWPGLGGRAPREPWPLGFVQSAPFLLTVVFLLVYLASQTLDK
jgi:hypothetical protein